jgi:hypothetical protein
MSEACMTSGSNEDVGPALAGRCACGAVLRFDVKTPVESA